MQAPDISPALEQLIYQTILNSPSPLKEYDLLKTLTQAGYAEFDLSGSELQLFQAHFMLFHLLYRLQDQWQAAGKGSLEIHTLGIFFKKTDKIPKSPVLPDEKDALATFDSLKAYYLDFSAYYNTQEEEIQALLDGFWHRFITGQANSNLSQQQALELFELTPPFSAHTLKQRYRQLRQHTHPDKGGSNQAFQQVIEAYEILTAIYE